MPMMLWKVTNGYRGYTYLYTLVLAASEERALDLAQQRFHEKGREDGYDPDYWDRAELQATVIMDDLSTEQAAEPESV